MFCCTHDKVVWGMTPLVNILKMCNLMRFGVYFNQIFFLSDYFE